MECHTPGTRVREEQPSRLALVFSGSMSPEHACPRHGLGGRATDSGLRAAPASPARPASQPGATLPPSFPPRKENKSPVVEATITLDFLSHSVTLILTESRLSARKRIILSNTSKCQVRFQTAPVSGRLPCPEWEATARPLAARGSVRCGGGRWQAARGSLRRGPSRGPSGLRRGLRGQGAGLPFLLPLSAALSRSRRRLGESASPDPRASTLLVLPRSQVNP